MIASNSNNQAIVLNWISSMALRGQEKSKKEIEEQEKRDKAYRESLERYLDDLDRQVSELLGETEETSK